VVKLIHINTENGMEPIKKEKLLVMILKGLGAKMN
jgi:hypothetical protein